MALLENPLWTREVRSRMRAGRAVAVLLVFTAALALCVVWSYHQTHRRGQDALAGQIGHQVFGALAVVQGLLVCLLAPGLGAGAFTLEREQQTLDGLLAAPLRAGQLVAGKILAAGGFALLLLLAAAPCQAVCLMLGGCSPGEVAAVFTNHLLTLLLLLTSAVVVSSYSRTTAAAVIAAYLGTAAYLIGVSSVAGRSQTAAALLPLAGAEAMLEVSASGWPAVVPAAGLLLLACWWLWDLAVHQTARLRGGDGSWRLRVWPLLPLAGGAIVVTRTSAPADTATHLALGVWLAVSCLATGEPSPREVRWWQIWRPGGQSMVAWVALQGLVGVGGGALWWSGGSRRHWAVALVAVLWLTLWAAGCRRLALLLRSRWTAAVLAAGWSGLVWMAVAAGGEVALRAPRGQPDWPCLVVPLLALSGRDRDWRAALLGNLLLALLVAASTVWATRRAATPPPRAAASVEPRPRNTPA